MREAEERMANAQGAERDKAVRRYGRLEDRLHVLGGYAADSEAASIASSLGLPDRVLGQPLRTLSGGQRRRVELARILFSGADTLLLDEPTNHLDADSIVWLRDFLKSHQGGLIVISHDVGLLEAVVNKVFHLDANRCVIDLYNVGWKKYLAQRETDERRRKRERANAERQASTLQTQADKMRAKATKAKAAQQMERRAQRPALGRRGRAPGRQSRQDSLPRARSVWQNAAHGASFVEIVRFVGSLHGCRSGRRQGQPRRHPGPQRRGQDDAPAPARRASRRPTPASGSTGTGCASATTPRSTRPSTSAATVLENMRSAAPDLPEVEVRKILGSFLFTGDDVDKPAGVLSGGEKTRLALATLVVSSANVLLLDEPTNNLDPASRDEILAALRTYAGAIVLVTHDEGAVEALQPERVILLPDGVEDIWSDEFSDLVALA